MPRGHRPVLPSISQIVVGLLFIALLAGTVAFLVAALLPEPRRSPDPSDVAGDPTSSAEATMGVVPTGSPPGSGSVGTPSPGPSPSPTDGPGDLVMPVVPVVGFWEGQQGISRGQLVAALEGRSDRFPSVIVPTEDREAIARALDAELAESVRSGSPEEIHAAVGDGALGLLRASDLTPLVHALALDDRDLFGNTRVASAAEWPLSITLAEGGDSATRWDQAATWTLVAGGDVLLDRGVHQRVTVQGKGLAYPFDGGTAVITGTTCCGTAPGIGEFEIPVYQTRGDAGVVRTLIAGAGLGIATLEGPTPEDWQYHPEGTTFTGDPALLPLVAGGGIDWVTLANDHIGDAGRVGIRDTLRQLPVAGLQGAGAGVDLEAARAWSSMDVDGHRVALLPCSAVPTGLAGRSRGGARPCSDAQLVADIARASNESDVTIVVPHWGVEYQAEPTDEQRELAGLWVAEGADLILGSHSHVAGPVEVFEGKLAFFSLGNLVHDEDWSEMTMEGLLVEATFHGAELAQVRLRPTLIHDRCQPNLLDPARDGGVVLDRMRRLSEALTEV